MTKFIKKYIISLFFSGDVAGLVRKEQCTSKNYPDIEKEKENETIHCQRGDRVAPEAELPM